MPQSLSKVIVHIVFSTKDNVETQPEHHRRRTFQDEYRELLGKHGAESDERYVWE